MDHTTCTGHWETHGGMHCCQALSCGMARLAVLDSCFLKAKRCSQRVDISLRLCCSPGAVGAAGSNPHVRPMQKMSAQAFHGTGVTGKGGSVEGTCGSFSLSSWHQQQQ